MRVAPSLACIAAGFLSACSSFGGDNNPFTVFADPGQYQYHSCEQIAALRDAQAKRAQNLKMLMDKAEQSTGGAPAASDPWLLMGARERDQWETAHRKLRLNWSVLAF